MFDVGLLLKKEIFLKKIMLIHSYRFLIVELNFWGPALYNFSTVMAYSDKSGTDFFWEGGG